VNTAPATCFLMTVGSKQEERQARFVIESLRAFGGELQACPVWVFSTRPESRDDLAGLSQVTPLPLEIEAPYRSYPLSDKVFACAQAEALAGAEVRSLVWLNLDCLIVNPPLLFNLGPAFDAALRPVHIRNVGSLAAEPLDDHWQKVYQTVGVEGVPYTLESFVDAQTLRPYFNTHCFAINPAKGIMQTWREHFKALVADQAFQAGPCGDELHQVFLHQVVLSAIITNALAPERICRLPPEYSYPLHLHPKLPGSRRAPRLNHLVCAVHEEADEFSAIEVQEPLKSWLAVHSSQG
jgi:hypothetical protein